MARDVGFPAFIKKDDLNEHLKSLPEDNETTGIGIGKYCGGTGLPIVPRQILPGACPDPHRFLITLCGKKSEKVFLFFKGQKKRGKFQKGKFFLF
jgi:hypothetical protein